jgi:sulfite reductase alpha subunit-like flavoprotein
MEFHKNRSQVSMAEEVTGVLAEIIAKFGKVSPDRAAVTLNKMKDEGRYCEDIFGQ